MLLHTAVRRDQTSVFKTLNGYGGDIDRYILLKLKEGNRTRGQGKKTDRLIIRKYSFFQLIITDWNK